MSWYSKTEFELRVRKHVIWMACLTLVLGFMAFRLEFPAVIFVAYAFLLIAQFVWVAFLSKDIFESLSDSEKSKRELASAYGFYGLLNL
jgi:hypothetical protein